jgi:hypothetical protein
VLLTASYHLQEVRNALAGEGFCEAARPGGRLGGSRSPLASLTGAGMHCVVRAAL